MFVVNFRETEPLDVDPPVQIFKTRNIEVRTLVVVVKTHYQFAVRYVRELYENFVFRVVVRLNLRSYQSVVLRVPRRYVQRAVELVVTVNERVVVCHIEF